MARPTLLAWDVGGVLLSNGWDTPDRERTCASLGVDFPEYERRHHELVDPFERGRLTLPQYLDRALKGLLEPPGRERFREAMFAASRPAPAALAFARELASSGRYALVTLNNESRELNDYRIDRFALADFVDGFYSSCYTGLRKPEEAAFRQLLAMTHRAPGEVVFVDDRSENVAVAQRLGLRAVRYQGPEALRRWWASSGLALP